MRQVAKFGALVAAALILAATPALAGPPGPPDYGTVNPTGLSCPPAAWGVEKCLPAGWAPESSGVHIVTDEFVDTGAAAGTVTFWCQSINGFKYDVRVHDLDRNATYTVKAVGGGLVNGAPVAVELDLGVLHTDTNGGGTTAGVEQLANGFYELVVQVWAGSVLVLDTSTDPQGFVVF